MAGDDPPNPSPSSLGIRLMSEMWHLTGGMAGCYEESLVLMEDKRLDMERRLDEMRARLLVLEHMNQNVCIRRRNAFLRRLGPEAELRPLVSVVRGGGIEGFPGTMREWERLTVARCIGILGAIKAPFDRNSDVEVLRALILVEWCPDHWAQD